MENDWSDSLSYSMDEIMKMYDGVFLYSNPLGSYCKTPLISTYVFSGLATVQVLIFGGRTYFRGGMIRRGEKSSKEEVCSIW